MRTATSKTRSPLHGIRTLNKIFAARLQGTPYGEDDYIETLREEFDQKTKCLFDERTGPQVYVPIGRRRDHFIAENGACRIKSGLFEVQRCDFPSSINTVNH